MEEPEKKDYTPIEQRTDRDIVQSYIFTFARYGELTMCEKQILYNMIYDKQIQDYVRESITNRKNGKELPTLPNCVGFMMPLSKITQNKGTYQDVKNAFVSLAKKGFEYEDNRTWKYLSFIVLPKIKKWEGVAYFQVPNEVYKVITEISRGYRQFSLDVALSLKSVYSMRFYEMFSRQDQTKEPIKRKIEDIKRLFRLEDKYTANGMFIKRVLEPAKKELDEKANYSFDYELQKSLGSRKYDIIIFRVYHIPENEIKNEELTENRVKAIVSKVIKISNPIYKAMIDMGFEDEEIYKNIYTLYVFEDVWKRQPKGNSLNELLSKFDEIKNRALSKDRGNWKGYFFGTLKRIAKIENGKERDKALAIALKNDKNNG